MLHAALLNALSAEPTARAAAESALTQADAASLLAATEPATGLPEPARLLAATQLKNTAVRHWRRGAAQEHERIKLREALAARLARPEPSPRVGTQIALAVARVMRSEANAGEATVLESFAAALRCAHLPGHALLALLHTAKELGSMRLPAQRRLAARVGHVMVALLGPLWEAAVRQGLAGVLGAAASSNSHGAAEEEALRLAVLHTKVLRHMLALQSKGGWANAATAATAATAAAEGLSGSSVTPWQPADACALAIEAARQLQAQPLSAVPVGWRNEWSRLGSAVGKLLIQLHTAQEGGALIGGHGNGTNGNGGIADAAARLRTVSRLDAAARTKPLLDAAAHLFVAEAEGRRALRRAAAGGSAALDELEARERFGSSLPLHLASLLELGASKLVEEAWLYGEKERFVSIVHAAVGLMGRTVRQLQQWSADPESFACEVLLPPADELEEEEEEGDEGAGGGFAYALGSGDEDEEADDEDGANDDDGIGGGDDAEEDAEGDSSGWQQSDAGGGGAASAGERLRAGAESLLTSWLCSMPDEVGIALLALLPPSACTAADPLDAQIDREASYTALGLGGWQLQHHLSYAQLLTAILNEEAALKASAPPPMLSGALQARLCWLVSCWWAFGSGGDPAEDERLCDASYSFLVRQLAASDLAVRLQAAHVLSSLVRAAGREDVAQLVPHATQALVGLAAILGACTADDGCLWTLRAMGAFLRRVGLPAEARAGVVPVLEAVWQRAEREQRGLLLRGMRAVAVAVRA